MIWNYHHFSKQNIEFAKFYKLLFIKKLLREKCNLLGNFNYFHNKLHSKIHSYEKNILGKKLGHVVLI